jgi:acyl dehydratase
MDIKGPVCVGDTLYVEIEVTELKPTSDGKRGLVRTLNRIVNQRGEVVIEYAPLRMQKRRPSQ